MVNGQSTTENALSQAALGRALGLSPAAITKLKGQGMPVHSIEAARAWREERLNVAARKPEPAPAQKQGRFDGALPGESSASFAPPGQGDDWGGDGLPEDFQMARTRREIAEANLAEMREAELEGKLIRVDTIRAAWAKRISSTRDALMQLPHRLAPVLAVESDIERVGLVLDEALHQALTELSRDAIGSAGQGGN